MTWTREHDRILAEKCEGWTHVEGGSQTAMRDGACVFRFLPSYHQDLVAVVRAAEAWRKQRDGRYWRHGVSEQGDEWAEVGIFGEWYSAINPAALAHALYQAVSK